MLLFDGGYVDFSGEKPRYCWYTKDHLGSVRVVSDADGNWSLKVAAKSSIVFSCLGYMDVTEPVGGRSVIDVSASSSRKSGSIILSSKKSSITDYLELSDLSAEVIMSSVLRSGGSPATAEAASE